MIDSPVSHRPALRAAVLDGLESLRRDFPLEERLRNAASELKQAYGQILAQWLQGRIPDTRHYDRQLLNDLQALEAIVPVGNRIGCYPFAADDTGIRVQWTAVSVQAMCAIDALAIARLTESTTRIDSSCLHCQAPLALRMEANGGLDHDQADRAQVAWLPVTTTTGCSSSRLCRAIRFLCNDCTPPTGSRRYSLPQAAAIGNAFFAFQRALWPDRLASA